MKIAIFGATGGTGRLVLERCLEQNYQVNALVRTPGQITIDDPNLTIIHGDVLNRHKVEETLIGTEAVICSLGSTANNPEYVVSDGTSHIITGMQELGIRRLIVVTSLGVGNSKNQVPFFFKTLMKTVLRSAIEDKERQERVVMASGLDWTIVRPGGLTDGPATGKYVYGLNPKIKAGQVSRADVADFLLLQLENDEFLHKTPAIT